LPTVLELVGLEAGAEIEGVSLQGMMDEGDRESRPAYSEATTYGTERESVRVGGCKYIHRISYGQLIDPMSSGLSLTPRHELYDLKKDPGERINISADNPDKVQELEELMNRINPNRAREGMDPGTPSSTIDLSLDPEILESLRSLGYIQ